MTEYSIIENLFIGDRLRGLKQDRVDALAKSMDDIGLQTPITIYIDDNHHGILVTGLHRLKAAEKLGWEEIPVLITYAAELDRQLWEIDENLMRADLTELEQAEHLKRRKEIFDARAVKKIDAIGRKQSVGFDTDAAEKTGLTKQAVHKSRQRAEKIADDVKEQLPDLETSAGKKPAESGVELDALASLSHEDQRKAVKLVDRGQAENLRDAKNQLTGVDTETEKNFKSLCSSWKRAKEPAREQFLDWLEATYGVSRER